MAEGFDLNAEDFQNKIDGKRKTDELDANLTSTFDIKKDFNSLKKYLNEKTGETLL